MPTDLNSWIHELRDELRRAGCLKRVADADDQWVDFFHEGYTPAEAVRESLSS